MNFERRLRTIREEREKPEREGVLREKMVRQQQSIERKQQLADAQRRLAELNRKIDGLAREHVYPIKPMVDRNLDALGLVTWGKFRFRTIFGVNYLVTKPDNKAPGHDQDVINVASWEVTNKNLLYHVGKGIGVTESKDEGYELSIFFKVGKAYFVGRSTFLPAQYEYGLGKQPKLVKPDGWQINQSEDTSEEELGKLLVKEFSQGPIIDRAPRKIYPNYDHLAPGRRGPTEVRIVR